MKRLGCLVIGLVLALTGCFPKGLPVVEHETLLKMTAAKDHARRSEGDFHVRTDGTVVYYYSNFVKTSADDAFSYIAARYSTDGGQTWSSNDEVVFPDRVAAGINEKHISLLRLQNGEVAMFYLIDNRLEGEDQNGQLIYPVVRISQDDGLTWSEPIVCTPGVQAAFPNNDRVIQLEDGRIIMPAAYGGGGSCWYSDDNARSFKLGQVVKLDDVALQEPGIVELYDGRLLMFMRTNTTYQYLSYSDDRGESWSAAVPSSIRSPLSPASIERIPGTQDLVMVWNYNWQPWIEWTFLVRSPYNAAVSKDNGLTWENIQTIYEDKLLWYCYSALEFIRHDGQDYLLLGHTASGGIASERLADEWITRIRLDDLYM